MSGRGKRGDREPEVIFSQFSVTMTNDGEPYDPLTDAELVKSVQASRGLSSEKAIESIRSANAPSTYSHPDWSAAFRQFAYLHFLRWYEEFHTAQLMRRDWVPFGEVIADFAGTTAGGGVDPVRAGNVCRRLFAALRMREFDRNGRCSVHFLWFDDNSYIAQRAGTWVAESADSLFDLSGNERARAYLSPCWIPRRVLLDWCEANGETPNQKWVLAEKAARRRRAARRSGRNARPVSQRAVNEWYAPRFHEAKAEGKLPSEEDDLIALVKRFEGRATRSMLRKARRPYEELQKRGPRGPRA